MRFRTFADGDTPLTVRVEPSDAEYVLQPGDFFDFEWEESADPPMGCIIHSPTELTVAEGAGRARMWNSQGTELSMLGGDG